MLMEVAACASACGYKRRWFLRGNWFGQRQNFIAHLFCPQDKFILFVFHHRSLRFCYFPVTTMWDSRYADYLIAGWLDEVLMSLCFAICMLLCIVVTVPLWIIDEMLKLGWALDFNWFLCLPYRLGLTQEESQEQNLVQEDAENRTAVSVKGETRLPRGPSTRQRDGHFKKRSRADLRCRARRSLYKLRDSEQKEASKETASVGVDSSLHKDTKPEVDLKKDDLTSASATVLKPESSELHLSPETSKLHSKSEDLSLATANRIPCLSQESSAREPKDQKRKCFEEAASASFPEKKPRLEDRQSFRNTIESVHSEKPQPTKEEPKVPPIRVGKRIIAAWYLRALTLSSIKTLLKCQVLSC